MKRLIFLLIFAATGQAHQIQGTWSDADTPMVMSRTTIPFDSSLKTDTGRVYTLWIAPDGALVFYIEKPWAPIKLDMTGIDKRFRVWIVNAKKEMTLPENFEKLDNNKKGAVEGVEELVGHVAIDWRTESDYTISLDIKGVKKPFSFKGDLLGGIANKSILFDKKIENTSSLNFDKPTLSSAPELSAKQFLTYLYGKDTPQIVSLCSGNQDVWMLQGSPNLAHQGAVEAEKIDISDPGVYIGSIENEICIVEIKNGKVVPEFNLKMIEKSHRELILHFIYYSLLQEKTSLKKMTTKVENISFGGAPKAGHGDMDVYADVLNLIPVIRISDPASDATSHSVTYRLPLGKEGFNVKVIKRGKEWLIDTDEKITVPLEFFWR